MNKRNLWFSRSGAIKVSLFMVVVSILGIGCGKDSGIVDHEIGNTTSCTLHFCGTSGIGGSAGATGNGGTGGHGGNSTSVGGAGGGSSSSSTGGSGGSAGTLNTGGAGGQGGSTTSVGGSGAGGDAGTTTTITGTGGSGSAGTGGHAGGTTTSTSGNGGQGGATTTATDAGVGGAGGASTTATDAGAVCTVDQKGCNNVCVQKSDPAYGCSIFACSACPVLANATSACGANHDCVVGACSVGFGNCDNNAANGCESQYDSDPNNCGTCGTVCAVNSLCQGGSCVQQPLNSFSCSGWTRDLAFDAFKINGVQVSFVGGIWGTNGDDFYIPVATYSNGAVAHWYGGVFHLESLPEDLNDPVKEIHGIWGSGLNDTWVTANAYKGRLFHRDAQGVWTRDMNAPMPKGMFDIWGLDASHVYLLGEDPGVGRVWKKSGVNWINTNLPNPMQAGDSGFYVSLIWGFDLTHIFVTGTRFNSKSVSTGGVFWMYDGANWTIIQTPPEVMGLGAVHGTSFQDFYVNGQSGAGALVYRVTNKVSTWTPFVNPNFTGYGPLLSLKVGTFLTATYQPPAGAGQLRITTGDQISPAITVPVDNKAYNPVSFWREPGTMKIHLVLNSSNNSPGGHYIGSCQ